MTRVRETESEILGFARDLIEPEYRAVVDRLPTIVRHVGGYHVGWWDVAGRSAFNPGKAIRPALVVTSAAAMSDESVDANRGRVIAAALAVELVHDYSQLHDDIMDGDQIRRHRPTAWAQFGLGPAILTGDMFLAGAFELLVRHDVAAVEILARAFREMCEGQAADLDFEQRVSVGLDECVRMSEQKTAALMSASCELGAWAAGVNVDRMIHMREFGFHVGRTFQLVDDLLGIFGDPQATGKPLYADLVHRKKSLPVVAALNSGTPAGREFARRYTNDGSFSHHELVHLAQLVEDAGGRRWAEQQARRSRSDAECALRAACPEPGAAEDLLTLAELIMRRDS
jgi:geranylgeranyl diphosphate synthase type I